MGAPLLAAAASADVTPRPAEGVFLAGFAPNRRALGVLHPLEAGVLAFQVGDQRLALVTVDSIGLGRDIVQRIRQAVTAKPAPHVLVSSTHSHATPDTMGIWGPALLGLVPYKTGVDPAYVDLLVGQVAAAIDQAVAALAPVVLKAARFQVPTRWTRNDRGPTAARDDDAVALAVDSVDGLRVATVLNYASHPETLWDKNRYVSPDYPGAFRRRLREVEPGVPLFFQADLGGMLTANTPQKPDQQARRAFVDEMGTALADLARDAVAGAPPIDVDRLVVHHTEVAIPVDNWRFRLMHRLGLLARASMGPEITTELNLVEMGPLRVLTWPGEALPEVGRRVKDQHLDGEFKMWLGLGCDEMGYILEPEMFGLKLYAYEKTMSMGPRTTPLLVEALDRLRAS